jgi:hypothetical protein
MTSVSRSIVTQQCWLAKEPERCLNLVRRNYEGYSPWVKGKIMEPIVNGLYMFQNFPAVAIEAGLLTFGRQREGAQLLRNVHLRSIAITNPDREPR